MVKVTLGAIMMMWSFTIFLAMFWWYLPAYLDPLGEVFLILAVIQSAITFRVSITKKF